MEGVVGAVTAEQLRPGGFEYERFRGFMTAEVNAAIDAAREAGATQFVVADSHGNGQNLLIERLPDDVTVVRSSPREFRMMGGIDDTFDGVIFLGYHASTANMDGVRAHTFSSANITGLTLNGIEMSEGSMNAAIAGHFGVPVIMVSGDDVAVAENQAVIGDIEGAVVKWALGFHSAESLTPEAAYEVIRTRTAAAINRIDDFEPYVLETPIVHGVEPQALPARGVAGLPAQRGKDRLAHDPVHRRGHPRSLQLPDLRDQLPDRPATVGANDLTPKFDLCELGSVALRINGCGTKPEGRLSA